MSSLLVTLRTFLINDDKCCHILMFIASPVQVQACITHITYYDGHYRRFTGLCTHHLCILIGHRCKS